MRILFLFSLNLFCVTLLYAKQSDTLYPEPGKRCPEFILKNVAYYSKIEIKLEDFKGKWLILDFWNKYCSACVASFPKVNAMQKKFGDRVQFILVGIQDPEQQIRTMYERFQRRLNLKLPCAFDSTISNYWGIYNTPHIIIIDDKGVVQAVTFTIDSSAIEKFLTGETPDLPVAYKTQNEQGAKRFEQKIPFDGKKPYMINDNGGMSDTGYLFRSVLTKYNQASQHYYSPVRIDLNSIDSSYPKGMFQVLAASLKQLYLYAYFGAESWRVRDTSLYGKYSNNLALEIHDSSLFQSSSTKNQFCYSLIVPPDKGSKENLQIAMQRDLKTYFGYDVSVEARKISCWRLVSTEKAAAMLKAKGGNEYIETIIPNAIYNLHNVSTNGLNGLVQCVANVTKGTVIDETGITGKIDITLHMMDVDDLKQSLRSSGLDLIQSEKEMKVLVIRDAK